MIFTLGSRQEFETCAWLAAALLPDGSRIKDGRREIFGQTYWIHDILVVIFLLEGLTLSVHESGRNKDDKVAFDFLLYVRAE